MTTMNPFPLPKLVTGHRQVDQAWQVAVGDLIANIQPMQIGLLDEPRPVIQAGLVYDHPWTRDAAFNTWNAVAMIYPAVARDTMRSVLQTVDGELRIGGQYWDAIVWACGAWHLYLATGDRSFLREALEAVTNSLRFFERTEFDDAFGLFRGGACFQDGIAGYPDRYADTVDLNSGIEHWQPRDPALRHPVGQGFPAHCLSTNCLYQQGYILAGKMARELGQSPDTTWSVKAAALAAAIERQFWMSDQRRYRYLVDRWGTCDLEEGFGHAFAILFGLADASRARHILSTLAVTNAGFPCGWPTFKRYARLGAGIYGRHAGTVWPHVNAFLAEAAARVQDQSTFGREFIGLAKRAARDGQFAEIYHPNTALPYGGVQENGPGHDLTKEWFVGRRQTWCATGYMRMVTNGLFGMRYETGGIRFEPCVPDGVEQVKLTGLEWRGGQLDLSLTGRGKLVRFVLDGGVFTEPFLPGDGRDHVIEIHCS